MKEAHNDSLVAISFQLSAISWPLIIDGFFILPFDF